MWHHEGVHKVMENKSTSVDVALVETMHMCMYTYA